jgi:hypothetical protein
MSSLNRQSGLSYKSSLGYMSSLESKSFLSHKSGLGQPGLDDTLDLTFLESRLSRVRGRAVMIPVPGFDRLSQI